MEPVMGDRIIALIDMDCFYVQVEQKLCPEFDDKPCTVAQYNNWEGGGIIAVNYEARAFGVKRGMRGDAAKKLCPDIHNFRVPEVRGKADLTRYREAGALVMEVLCEYCDCVERASIDEAFLDMTGIVAKKMDNFKSFVSPDKLPNTHIVGWNKESKDDDVVGWLQSISEEDIMLNDQKLAVAAVLVEEIRAAVYSRTRFRCSAGIAHNKMLSKLACGLHKPNKQTVLPQCSVPILYKNLPVRKVRFLGGKLGEEVQEKLGIEMMGELMHFSEAQLSSAFGSKTGSWLYGISRGVEHEAVTARQLPKSVGCGKNFPGKQMLNTKEKVAQWLEHLSTELNERLVKDQASNKRFAKTLTVSLRLKDDKQVTSQSRTCAIHSYDTKKIAHNAMHAIQKLNTAPPTSLSWRPPILTLSLAASKFEDTLDSCTSNIRSFFSAATPQKSTDKQMEENRKDISLSSTIIESSSNARAAISNKALNKLDKKGMRSFFKKGLTSTQVDITIRSPPQNCSESAVNQAAVEDNSEISGNNLAKNLFEKTNCDEVETANKISMPITTPTEVRTNSSNDLKPKGFFARKLLEKESALKTDQVSNQMSSDTDDSDTENNPTDIHDVSDKDLNSSTVLSFDIGLQNSNNAVKDDLEREKVDLVEQPSTTETNLCIGAAHQKIGECIVSTIVHDSDMELPSELSVLCHKCNVTIPCWEKQEHEDYHFAVELQHVMQPEAKPVLEEPLNKAVTRTKTFSKRAGSKKPPTGHKQKKIKPQQNTLDAFLK